MRHLLTCILCTVLHLYTSAQNYESHDVIVYTNDGIRLGATITAPNNPKAAILLITGSGIQNRDEEILGKKPFKTLAESLSTAGYAVMRVDDRGYSNPSDANDATIDTDLNDAQAAISKLDSIYPSLKKGLIGHSSGGSVAIRMGAQNAQLINFIITLAAPAWAGDSIIMSQSRAYATALTGTWEAEQLQRELITIAKSNTPTFMARPSIMLSLSNQLGKTAKLPQIKEQLEAQTDALLSPWYRSMLRYNPAKDIASITIPFLALNGSKDYQVLVENLETIKMLNSQAEIVKLENHNHLFQVAQSGLPQEYANLQGDISKITLSTIKNWLVKITK